MLRLYQAALGCSLLLLAAGCNADPKNETQAEAAGPSADATARIERLDPALDGIISPSAVIEKVATGFQFIEGPMWREGRLWFSDLTGNKILAVSPDGKVEQLMDQAGGLEQITGYKGSNALATDRDGSVLVAQHGARRIARLSSDFTATTYIDKYAGKQLNSPNDMAFHPDGSLWFTDPPYGLDEQDKSPLKQQSFNGVYRYDGGEVEAVITDLPRPNGLAFSPDGKVLYVSNSENDMMVKRYDVGADGKVGAGQVLIAFPGPTAPDVPDGVKVDSQGNVWAAGPGGIRIITPQGKVLGQIKLPEVAANLAWGDDGSTAYITASSSVYRIRMLIPGTRPLDSR